MVIVSEPEPEDLVERALVRIRRDQQERRLHRARVQGDPAADSSTDAARFRYLDALDALDGAETGRAISEVARAIGVDRPRASRLTSELLDGGLVERRPAPDDSRYVLVRLTARGRAVVDEARLARRTTVGEALAGFTADESRAFAELLGRFVAAWPREDPEGPRG